MDSTGSMGVAENSQSLFDVFGIIEHVSEDIGPRVTVSGHFY
jgi:hypothetical protein